MNEPKHIDLFSGIGGFSLAASWAGFRTVAFVEREPYCQKILAQHWPEVPIFGDIYEFDGKPFSGVELLTGGFPCQPFSQAGKRRGKEDDRYLWPEMLRVISEAKPHWVLGENVAGLDGLGLDDCISDLESIGYEVAPPLEIPACATNAKHVRNRIWILANSRRSSRSPKSREQQGERTQESHCGCSKPETLADTGGERSERRGLCEVCGSGDCQRNSGERKCNAASTKGRCKAMADAGSIRQSRQGQLEQWGHPATNREGQANHAISMRESREWPVEPELGRVANGIPNRTHRLKGLGNAIVPQVAFQILKEIRKLI